MARHQPPTVKAAAVVYRVAVFLMFFFLVLPLVIVVPMSFSSAGTLDFPPPGFSLQYFEAFLTSDVWTEAAVRSMRIGVFSSLVATSLGMLAAYALYRYRVPGGSLVRSFLLLPMVTPLIVIAAGVNLAFAPRGLINSELGLVLAHASLGVPFTFLLLQSAFLKFDPALEQAGLSLGATPMRTFCTVLAPIMAPSVLTAAFFAFIVSFDEVVIASFIAGRGATTLPKRMWDSIFVEIDPVIPVVATLMVTLTFLIAGVLAVVRRLYLRRMGADHV